MRRWCDGDSRNCRRSCRLRAENVFRADLYDSALDKTDEGAYDSHVTDIGAFFDPVFDPADIAGYLASWRSKRARPPRLTIVR